MRHTHTKWYCNFLWNSNKRACRVTYCSGFQATYVEMQMITGQLPHRLTHYWPWSSGKRMVPLHEYGWVSHSIPWLRVSSCLQTNNWALRVCVHLLVILVPWKCWLDKISWCLYRTEAAEGWLHLWGRECFWTSGAWHKDTALLSSI